MNEELKGRLVKYLDNLEVAATKAHNFAAAEIPETIREYLLWLAIERSAYAVLFLIAAIVVIILGKMARASARDLRDSDDRNIALFFSWSVPTAFASILVCVGVTYALSATKAIVAPRVVMVEEVAKIVKANK